MQSITKRFRRWQLLIVLAAVVFVPLLGQAEDLSSLQQTVTNDEVGPSVSALSKRGEHFQALTKYYDTQDFAFSLSDLLAAARSAWALGLIQLSRSIWDQAFQNPALKSGERFREILSRAIMELQEGNFEKARTFAEEAVYDLESSDIRSQLFLVIAESLKEQGVLESAQTYYEKAALEGSKQSRNEAHYLLGECQQKLGLLDRARYGFTAIGADSSFTSSALLHLANIDFKEKEYEGVLTWLGEGEERYPMDFDDGWVHYEKITALLELGRGDQAKKELDSFQARYSPMNNWYVLARAAYLSKEMQGFPAEPKKKPKDLQHD